MRYFVDTTGKDVIRLAEKTYQNVKGEAWLQDYKECGWWSYMYYRAFSA